MKLALIVLLAFGCRQNIEKTKFATLAAKDKEIPNKTHPLVSCYPEYVRRIEGNYLIWTDGEQMIFDDGNKKTIKEMLQNPDIEDQFYFEYPANSLPVAPPHFFDPGRIRCEPFFKKIYGNDQIQVEQNLVIITWLPNIAPQKIRVTKINAIDQKLIKVSNELESLPDEYHKFIRNIGGSYNYRNISGTHRLSAHAYGIAIDLNVANSDYWKWDNTDIPNYKNSVPFEIVKIFEKYGFIWGGRWYHYDTMHFEYRPELIGCTN